MEVGTIQNSIVNLFLAEFLGTLLFMTTIFYSSLYHNDLLTIAVGVGIGNFIANVAFGSFTGGHFNPSVSIGKEK
jgi:glycerol uptake facilitator-like aquaporin